MRRMTQPIVQSFPGRRGLRLGAATAVGITLILVAAAIPASAQFFPTEDPAVVFSDDFSDFSSPPPPQWTIVRWSGGSSFDGNWVPSSDIYGCAAGDTWLQPPHWFRGLMKEPTAFRIVLYPML